MDQLKGRVVNVVLTIQEGKGMEAVKNLVFISANFNGRVLESDPVNASDCPCFNTNLIWEIEKRDLRKIRSSNQPLRVECLSVDNQNRREKFGHVLLDLRSAQILEDTNAVQVPFKWHKIIGVRNKKRNCSPELFVSLTIRSHLEALQTEVDVEEIKAEPRVDSLIPIKYLEDGYIKVGELDECNQDFSLNIVIKSASNLDLLLPEVLVFHQNKNKYSMCLKIFGIPIKTKQFSKDLQDTVQFDEKIVVRLLSSVDVLKNFFNEEKLEIGFYSGTDLLGISTVGFEQLTNFNEKLLLNSCTFRFPSPNGIVPLIDGRLPTVSIEISLMCNIKIDYPSLVAQENDKASGDHVEVTPRQEVSVLITEDHVNEVENWKRERQLEFEEEMLKKRLDFEEELKNWRMEEIRKSREELELKKTELDDHIRKCRDLQDELQEKLQELKLAKALRKKRKASVSLVEIIEENQKKFADCNKELLIDYISKLQSDNESLKLIINEQHQELDGFEKTALTKEQTANLLQELKGLEEKFEAAQQTKTYFKEQWKKACQEIHEMKTEDYRQLQDQLKERREELSQLQLDNFYQDQPEDSNKILEL